MVVATRAADSSFWSSSWELEAAGVGEEAGTGVSWDAFDFSSDVLLSTGAVGCCVAVFVVPSLVASSPVATAADAGWDASFSSCVVLVAEGSADISVIVGSAATVKGD